jgi:murein DD-endopeptidase MepM/ murein hydrolase activator NlpD
MLSLKTKDVPPKRTFLIVLSLFVLNGGLFGLFAHQVATVSEAQSSVVKDDSVVTPDASQIEDSSDDEQLLVEQNDKPVITTYIVKSGDTLSGIASQFNISVNTIRWANDLTTKTSKINIGDELVILPVTGLEYTVKKGDTLSGIAVKFDVSQSDILEYNDIEASSIKVGMKIVLPNAEPIVPKVATPTKSVTKTSTSSTKTIVATKSSESSIKEEDKNEDSSTNTKFINPIPGAILTQGIHDGNAVDFGAPIGTSVYATAEGTVLIAKSGGYNSGYGSYIVINHEGGAQTLYGHLSSVSVSPGDTVKQGDLIAKSGNTGRSTGPHLHYKEIGTGARNTFGNYKKGTQF